MVRDHVHHIHDVIDDRALPVRGAITFAALLSLPVFESVVRTAGDGLGLGRLLSPLLVLAHVPAVIALVAVRLIGCDVPRTEGAA